MRTQVQAKLDDATERVKELNGVIEARKAALVEFVKQMQAKVEEEKRQIIAIGDQLNHAKGQGQALAELMLTLVEDDVAEDEHPADKIAREAAEASGPAEA